MASSAYFFVSGEEEALRYAGLYEAPDEYNRIDVQLEVYEVIYLSNWELEILWAIFEGKKKRFDRYQLELMLMQDGGMAYLFRLPNELTRHLAQPNQQRLDEVGLAWSKNNEMHWGLDAIEAFLKKMHSMAEEAIENEKSIYLWGCI